MIKEIEYGSIQGLNKSRYLLIELPFGDVPDNANRLCHELQSLDIYQS